MASDREYYRWTPGSMEGRYHPENDTLSLQKKWGKMVEIPAMKLYEKYDGNFWAHRRRRLLDLDRERVRRGDRMSRKGPRREIGEDEDMWRWGLNDRGRRMYR